MAVIHIKQELSMAANITVIIKNGLKKGNDYMVIIISAELRTKMGIDSHTHTHIEKRSGNNERERTYCIYSNGD